MAKRSSDEIIVGMYNDLKRYAQSGKANPQAVMAKEMFISEVKEAFEEKEAWIAHLEADIEKLIKVNFGLKNKIEKLEAVCFIHGIDDLPRWMAKNLNSLVDDVRINEKFNLTQIPDTLLENPAWREFYQQQMDKIIEEK